MLGERIGPYRIDARIGAGGMGDVYRATDTRLDREVAVKFSKAEFGERFEREARAVAALNHPRICPLYDVGPNYLVMELVDGTPLKGPMPADKAVEYAVQILEALEAAHRKGITHRDLKPANILLTKQGIKLLDFGLAKRTAPLKETDATLTEALTAKGQIAGTLQYMAPEQLQGKEADARSDLFAFGCVLYEMLSGKRAFDGETAASVIGAILHREPAPLDVHPPLGRVIRTCLAKDPDQRFQSAPDLKRALEWASEPAVAAEPGRPARWPLAAGLCGLVLAGWAGWALSGTPAALEQPVVRFQIAPPPGSELQRQSLAVSPDGRAVAFVARTNGLREVWVRRFHHNTPRRLAGTSGALYPFWSPDGRWIGYSTASRLWRIDSNGGTPLEICSSDGRGGAWKADGTIVLGTQSEGLLSAPASGGRPSPVESRAGLTAYFP